MKLARCSLLVLLAIGLTASCAHVPTMLNENPETAKLRAEYLRSHPYGAHNAEIQRGEVVRGMDAMEVLASWGVPQKRETKAKGNKELWSYTSRDAQSGDAVVYELAFADRILQHWTMDRSTAGSGATYIGSIRRVDDSLMMQGGNAMDSRNGVPRK